MSSDALKHSKDAALPDLHGWENHEELKLKETVIQRQNEVAQALKARSRDVEPSLQALISDMVEIAGVILKNTCGIGSAFKLADCDLTLMTGENINRFYTLALTQLAYHYSQLIPLEKTRITEALSKIVGGDAFVQDWTEKLAQCQDHEDGQYSAVRGGRLLWETIATLFAIKNWETNTTARIYYQTAPSQDLIYSIESLEK